MRLFDCDNCGKCDECLGIVWNFSNYKLTKKDKQMLKRFSRLFGNIARRKIEKVAGDVFK